MKYKTYKPIMETTSRLLRQNGLPNKRADVYQCMLKIGSKSNDPISCLMLVDELCWEKAGAHTLFLDSKELVDALLGSHIKMLGGDPPTFPFPSFAMSPPVESGLPSFLVCASSREDRERIGTKMLDEAGVPREFESHASKLGNIAVVITHEKGGNRCNVPRELLAQALETEPENMVNVLGTYRGSMLALDSEESKTLSTCLRLALATAAYLEARPEYLVPGCPGGFHRRELEGRAMVKGLDGSTSTVKAPPGLAVRKHGTPRTHWRVWHFRRYPLKKDGSRTAGMVFVSDSIVNEDIQQQPHTVVEGN